MQRLYLSVLLPISLLGNAILIMLVGHGLDDTDQIWVINTIWALLNVGLIAAYYLTKPKEEKSVDKQGFSGEDKNS